MTKDAVAAELLDRLNAVRKFHKKQPYDADQIHFCVRADEVVIVDPTGQRKKMDIVALDNNEARFGLPFAGEYFVKSPSFKDVSIGDKVMWVADMWSCQPGDFPVYQVKNKWPEDGVIIGYRVNGGGARVECQFEADEIVLLGSQVKR